MLRFHTQTAGVSLTAQQPQNNIVRTAIEALAAVLGGTQSLHTNSYDEALSLPTQQAVQVALRTQQILAHESGTANTIDPCAGSYYIEHLTDEIERHATDYLDRIEKLGAARCGPIETGFITHKIQESAWKFQQQVDLGRRIVVGVNEYITDEKQKPSLLRTDPAAKARQAARLDELRKHRNDVHVFESLGQLERAARGKSNLMPLILDCVEAYATLGEISDTLRRVFGNRAGGTLSPPGLQDQRTLPSRSLLRAKDSMIKRIDHIGIAVNNIDQALRVYADTLGLPTDAHRQGRGPEIHRRLLTRG